MSFNKLWDEALLLIHGIHPCTSMCISLGKVVEEMGCIKQQ